MLKVFVVDDEKLVRKGLISLIDWSRYGMQLIGEADNGGDALAFLRDHETDLLFTDLSMPGLSGMDFLRAVRDVRPDMPIVVLTMHQEFDLIQQALRIGVTDYITKAQIEKGSVDAIVRGILRRYEENRMHRRLSRRFCTSPQAVIVHAWEPETLDVCAALLQRAHLDYSQAGNLDLILSDGESGREPLNALTRDGRCVLVVLSGAQGFGYGEIGQILRDRVPDRLFFDYEEGRSVYTYALPWQENERETLSPRQAIEKLQNILLITDDAYYEQALRALCGVRMTAEERKMCLYQVNLYWAELSGRDAGCYFDEVSSFQWWYQWREWFDENRRRIRRRLGGNIDEIQNDAAIQKALTFIRENQAREISLGDLLSFTGMSKSHFCKNFKRVTGKTFVAYLNGLRVDAAKKYLLETRQPVYWIASQTGFASERYFRRVFQENTGEKPLQFRNHHKTND